MTTQSNTSEPSILVSRSVFLTAKEMIAAGLSKEWAAEELTAMYSGHKLSQDWFAAVIDSAAEVLNYTKSCNTHSGSV